MLRYIAAAALVLAPGAAYASPPALSGFNSAQDVRMGAFFGLRLRLPLGGPDRERQVRAVLTMAPTVHRVDSEGALRSRTGEGIEIGFRSDGKRTFSLAGQDLDRRPLGPTLNADEDDDGGIPTWAIVAGSVTAAAGIGFLIFWDALEDASE